MLSSLAAIVAKLVLLVALAVVVLLCFARRDGWCRFLLICFVIASQGRHLMRRRRIS